MRIALGETLRLKPDPCQQVARAVDGGATRDSMHLRPERHRVFNRQARIERRIAVLKYHLYLAAKLLDRQIPAANDSPVKNDLARRRCYQLHHEPRSGRFAAARFADHTQRFALEHFKIDTVYRTHHIASPSEQPALERKMLLQPADGQQGLGRAANIGRCLHLSAFAGPHQDRTAAQGGAAATRTEGRGGAWLTLVVHGRAQAVGQDIE